MSALGSNTGKGVREAGLDWDEVIRQPPAGPTGTLLLG